MKTDFFRMTLASILLWNGLSGNGVVAFARPMPLPPAKVRMEMIQETVSEIDRLDGEGLIPRKNRPETWHQTTYRLALEAEAAKTRFDLGQVFKRLDATYPNLHAKVTLAPGYDLYASGGDLKFAFFFQAEKINHGQKKFHYRISHLDKTLIQTIPAKDRPEIGDTLTSINGKAVEQWSKENFIFCKFPLREQCEEVFPENLAEELLGWDRTMPPLTFRLTRGKKTWDVKVPFQKVARHLSHKPKTACDIESGRYPGFHVVYKGYNACIFENKKHPDVSVWRIQSFAYHDLPKRAPIQNVDDETMKIFEKYWKARRPDIQKVILDVTDNGGGEAPIAWYKLFFSKPFQEQYFEIKKIKELDDPAIRKEIFYGEKAHELWFQNLKQSGAYDKIKASDFLPAQPQFCVSQDKDCSEGQFSADAEGYNGEVRILVNQQCVSSCSGFVWEMKDVLKEKVRIVGFPDSGDTAFARVYLDGILDKSSDTGFKFQVLGRPGGNKQALPAGALFRQQVSVTRSTDKDGAILSGVPVEIDTWIPHEYKQTEPEWITDSFRAALND